MHCCDAERAPQSITVAHLFVKTARYHARGGTPFSRARGLGRLNGSVLYQIFLRIKRISKMNIVWEIAF